MWTKVTLSRARMGGLLEETVELFLEYRDKHGLTEKEALKAAAEEAMQGLDATQELIESGEAATPHESFA